MIRNPSLPNVCPAWTHNGSKSTPSPPPLAALAPNLSQTCPPHPYGAGGGLRTLDPGSYMSMVVHGNVWPLFIRHCASEPT